MIKCHFSGGEVCDFFKKRTKKFASFVHKLIRGYTTLHYRPPSSFYFSIFLVFYFLFFKQHELYSPLSGSFCTVSLLLLSPLNIARILRIRPRTPSSSWAASLMGSSLLPTFLISSPPSLPLGFLLNPLFHLLIDNLESLH